MKNKNNLENIWEEFSKKLLGFIISKISSREDAEDILQEVFIKIQKNINSLQEDKKLKSWIYTIARNAIFDFYKSKKIKTSEFDEKYLQIEELSEDSSFLEISECLSHMIKTLPEKYSQALEQVDLQWKSQIELSKYLNISIPWAKSRVQRGRKLLKQMFIDCCKPSLDKHWNIIEVHQKGKCTQC